MDSLNTLADTNSFSVTEQHSSDITPDHHISDPKNISKHTKSPNRSYQHMKPKFTSTPKNTKTIPQPCEKAKTNDNSIPYKVNTGKVNDERVTILNINCRSIRNKIPEFHLLLDQIKPDVIAFTETWLKPDICSSEIFPEDNQFQVFRDDRTSGKGGGVMLAVSNRFVCEEQPDLKTDPDCNIVWTKLNIPGVKTIYLSAFYKPHENDQYSLLSLWNSLQNVPRNSIVWILGDLNMPDIDWTSGTVRDSCKFKSLYEQFLENLTNFNLDQVVKEPTRENNVLDLFLTNQPSQVHSTKILPSLGSSDHNTVFHEMNIKIGRPRQVKREIKQFKKANWDSFKSDLNEYFKNVFVKLSSNDPNILWEKFKNKVNELSSKYIPTKMTKPRSDLPWVTKKIIKMIHKRDKLHTKCKNAKGKEHYSKMRQRLTILKATIQREIRKSYWEYLESVIFSNDSET
ncbi:uncharacterized protein LOC128551897, partial [Mercenaria mercenaria]|uniref:uncharacterized protein LOC128551897 n=1 Tax=Mercenaria mercenaria TaxID=6596 RepID=UPI00234E636A